MAASSTNSIIGRFSDPRYDYEMDFYREGRKIVGERFGKDGSRDGPYPLDKSSVRILPSSTLETFTEDTINRLIGTGYVPIISNRKVTWLSPNNPPISKELTETAFSTCDADSSLNTSLPNPLSMDIASSFSEEEAPLFQQKIDQADKAFSSGNLPKAEEAYINALEQLIFQENRTREILCIESLGDVYQQRGTTESLVQAAGLYNYILLIAKDQSTINRMRLYLAEIEKKLLTLWDCPAPFVDTFDINRQKLSDLRIPINSKILRLSDDADLQAVQSIQREIALAIKGFIRDLIDQAVETLGPPPCEYAVMGFGSLAREEMTPYSDFEFGILISEENETTLAYFAKLTYLLHLKVVNLGETILPTLVPNLSRRFFDSDTPRGFAFDGKGTQGKGCKTPLGNGKTFTLLHTPEKMAQYVGKDEVGKWWFEKEPHLPMEMLNFTWITGNKDLVEAYGKGIEDQLVLPVGSGQTLREYLAKKHLFGEDLGSFYPNLDSHSNNGRLFRAKNDLYRFPHLAIERLSILLQFQKTSTFGAIEQLRAQRVLTHYAAENLYWWMSQALLLRLKTYSYYRAQREELNPILKPFGFEDPKTQLALDQNSLKVIQRVYQIFLPFYDGLKLFFSGNKEVLIKSSLFDESHFTMGRIAARLLQYQKAEHHFSKAVEENPESSPSWHVMGLMFLEIGKPNKALGCFRQAEKYYKEKDGVLSSIWSIRLSIGDAYRQSGRHKEAIAYYQSCKEECDSLPERLMSVFNQMGSSYQSIRNYEDALSFREQALEIARDLQKRNGKQTSMLPAILNNLGVSYLALNKPQKAVKYLTEAIDIEESIYGSTYPLLGTRYSNIGTAYQSTLDYDRALDYYWRALHIEKAFYGENHPLVALRFYLIGTICSRQGKQKSAIFYTHKALTFHRVHQTDIPLLVSLCCNMAIVYEKLGDYNQASKYHEEALQIGREQYKKNRFLGLALALNNIGVMCQKSGSFDQALKYHEEALQIGREHYRKDDPLLALFLNNLGRLNQKLNKFEDALIYQEEAVSIGEEIYKNNHPNLMVLLNNIAISYDQTGALNKALICQKSCLKIAQKLYEPGHPTMNLVLNNVIILYQKLGKKEKAASYQEQIPVGLRMKKKENHLSPLVMWF